MTQVPSPTIRARRLRRELRRLREAAGLTVEQVASELGWHRSKVIRIEHGHSRVSPGDVRELLAVYQITGEQHDLLLMFARQARQRGWWSAYNDVLRDDYLGFEAEAASISTFENVLVPGLLQTEDYARALIRATRPSQSPEEADRKVAVRVARKAMLTGDNPPALWVVIDEAALRRPVGSVAVMTAQLEVLAKACELPNVELQVLPFAAGAYTAMGGPFTILDYADPALDPSIVNLENNFVTHQLEEDEHVARYRLKFNLLQAKAADPDRSVDFLHKVANDLAR